MPAFYSDKFISFSITPTENIVGVLTQSYSRNHLDLKKQQIQTWIDSIDIFKYFYFQISKVLNVDNWQIIYEYKIPRRSKRIDIVLLSENLIYVIEIKNNQDVFNSIDIAQLEDYCLDLRDFHFESLEKTIIPILLCTNAPFVVNDFDNSGDFVKRTLLANKKNLSEIIIKSTDLFSNVNKILNINNWERSDFSPTPTIIEMAQMLYSGMNVTEISRHGADNLTKTTETVVNAIKNAQETNSKIICFITGVPGAGKTLAGLNIVHNREFNNDNNDLGIFLSGNSPLVKVLSESLARDYAKNEKITKNESRRRVKTFIYNVHEFIDDMYFDKSKISESRVIIYDEAQRAWTKEHKKRKSNGEITESEPDILFSIMDRIDGWAAIIALVGGGQEINTGEAGLREWGNSIINKYSNWKVHISSELAHGDHSTGNVTLFERLPSNISIVENEFLHLKVSLRSYKGKDLSKWVSLILDGKCDEANSLINTKLINYPICVTRNLDTAKEWLKKKDRGTRRIGLIASSGGRRLRAFGYDPYNGLRGDSTQEELGAWYLNPKDDIRSSNFLEIIGTEFAVQGLEIDWTGLFWDADLRIVNNCWHFKQFKGNNWQNISDSQKQRKQFIINKYRVLLTRAREGMVIWIPLGDDLDKTRQCNFYDETYNYLVKCGVKVLD